MHSPGGGYMKDSTTHYLYIIRYMMFAGLIGALIIISIYPDTDTAPDWVATILYGIAAFMAGMCTYSIYLVVAKWRRGGYRKGDRTP